MTKKPASGAATAQVTAFAAPPQAVTWGTPGSATTLVLYDTTNTFGWLGELYAMGAGNLATHFGPVTAEPVVDYVPGQVNDYTATIYLGSTYNEPLPSSFLNDVLSTTHPVIWAGDNVWQLTGDAGTPADTAFQAAYGWDPSTSYFDSADTVASVTYNGQQLTRNTDNGPVLAPHITTASAVTVLAQANCTDSTGAAATCNSIAQTTGTSFPWAIRSGNLTYIGEIPLSYITRVRPLPGLLRPAVQRPGAQRASGPPGAGPPGGRQPRHRHPPAAQGRRRLPLQPARPLQRRSHPRVPRPQRGLQQRDSGQREHLADLQRHHQGLHRGLQYMQATGRHDHRARRHPPVLQRRQPL